MKLYSKEALLIGGLYIVLSTPFIYFPSDIGVSISLGLLLTFILLMVLLFLNKTPFFITDIIKQYPQLSYYLASFGWLAYFMIIGLIFLPVIAGVFEWHDATMEKVTDIFTFICDWGIPVSLLIAFVKSRVWK